MPSRRRPLVVMIAGFVALTSSGCGAFIARTKIVGAQSAVEAARRADARKKSPYEFVSAQLYLEKAREEEAYGRFGAAIQFGGLAEKRADEARLNASAVEPEPPPEQ
jgi:hypothetical protein